ncbi:MAG TPA: protein kinase [Kofleriaceae bacterium]|nr:protein kinase [Kofleriaceae bacterium]
MERDPTEMSITTERHPSLAELKDPSHPNIAEHLARCAMCRSVVISDESLDAPIPLELPKGLVSDNAFRWPADPLAQGGMALIFLGDDRRLGRKVILKAPREGDDLPAGMADMFQRRVTAEARILAKLAHPSIVTIYELGKSTAGWPFCVLEKVDGASLRDRLDELALAERDGVPRTRERLELLASVVAIAEALAYAHERRVVHRDCTPNNILLGKRGEATLIDWGIARDLDAPSGAESQLRADEASRTGRGVTISAGTPPYLPYEQSQGRAADPSYDVYSFGITLYEIVSGRTPFDWKVTESQKERLRQLDEFLAWLQRDEPVPPAMERDPELSGIIARAMEHDAAKRFTADELVRALKQYLTGDLVFSHRYSVTGRLARWARQHRAASVAILSAIAFVITGALVWVQLERAAKESADQRALAADAEAFAARKAHEATQAKSDADAAKARAEQAVREGRDARELQREAQELATKAEDKRKSAESAAVSAKSAEGEAQRKFQDAMKKKEEAEQAREAAKTAQAAAEKEREAAKTAQTEAEKSRETAKTAREVAEKERDTARTAREAAEKERDAVKAAQAEAEKGRDIARDGQAAAEKERDAAVAARVAAEKERDEARRRIAELEARLPPSPPPGPGP